MKNTSIIYGLTGHLLDNGPFDGTSSYFKLAFLNRLRLILIKLNISLLNR